ncbi:SDR family NAD(P)-dependent oxidoreductase [Phytomonospora sp. NPDC050363]|uniref:SDR family NAD(P)-dependent oxidoreductase n=1 Tax=Phytomonospora sp. NPDC050363 TaxID=3155642 RepID=UPI0033F040F3
MPSTPSRSVIVVTGASAGIGRAAAVALAPDAEIVLVGRDRGRLDDALAEVRAAGGHDAAAYRSDFAALSDVRDLAAVLHHTYERIDVLANNAGLISGKGIETVDGYELTLQVNHLAGFLLANLLRDRLTGGRIITTSSAVHAGGRIDPAHFTLAPKYRKWRSYAESKQANILFTREAARRWGPEVLTAAFHPGAVRSRFGEETGLFRLAKRMPGFISPEAGARTLVWLATAAPGDFTSGGYYVRGKRHSPSSAASDDKVAHALWDASARATGIPLQDNSR